MPAQVEGEGNPKPKLFDQNRGEPKPHIDIKAYSRCDRMCFNYMSPYVKACRKGVVYDSDLIESPFSVPETIEQFDAVWAEECKTHKIGKRSYFRILRKATTSDYAYFVTAQVILTASMISLPLIMYQILDSVEFVNQKLIPSIAQLLWAIAFCFASICSYVSEIARDHAWFRCRLKTLVGIKAQILRKFDIMGTISDAFPSRGDQMNLLATEPEMASFGYVKVVSVLASFVQVLILGVGVPMYLLGVKGLIGITVLFLFLVLVMYVGSFTKPIDASRGMFRGERVKVTSEILDNMKFWKISTWVNLIGDEVIDLREKELKYSAQIMNVLGASTAICILSGLLVLLTYLTIYYSSNNEFEASVAFTLMSCITISSQALFTLPQTLNKLLMSKNSCRKIQIALEEEEPCKDWFEHFNHEEGNAKDCENISVEKSVFSYQYVDEATLSQIRLEASKTTLDWQDTIQESLNTPRKGGISFHENSEKSSECSREYPKLWSSLNMFFEQDGSSMYCEHDTELSSGQDDLIGDSENSTSEEPNEYFLLGVQCMKFNQGDHVAVVGSVSSGKSAFLNAILGEMICNTGHISVHGSFAYCPQEPWIFNGTIMANIILDSPMDNDWYSKVIEATCLVKDISSMPDEDSTVIGDGGDNLSGGQKQRISLARAIYARKDIYVLDDPLTALDMKVSKALFDACFNNLLKDTTVIMVLNQLDFQSHFNSTVLLECDSEYAKGGEAENRKLKMSVAKLILTETVIDTATIPHQIFDDDLYADKRSSMLQRTSTNFEISRIEIHDEEEGLGLTNWSTLFHYTRCCGWSMLILAVFLFILKSAFSSASTLLVGYTANRDTESTNFYLLLLLFSSGVLICFYSGYLLIGYSLMRGGKAVHDGLLKTMMRAPISFFNMTPLGGILNLFTTDILQMDYLVVNGDATVLIGRLIEMLFFVITAIIAIPIIAVLYVPATSVGISYVISLFPVLSYSMLYLCDIRQYHLAIFRSIMDGVYTMHAFELHDNIQGSIVDTLEYVNKASFNAWHVALWTRARVCFVSSTMVILGVFLIICGPVMHVPGITIGDQGIALLNIVDWGKYLQRMMLFLPRVLESLSSVHRLLYFEKSIKPEAAMIVSGQPPPDWPKSGSIIFSGINARYMESKPRILKSFNFEVKSGERIGIVGRSGCGKSTLGLVMFRLMEPESGTIFIDGVDYRGLGLKDLRQALSYVGQQPVMFSGTLRKNLDPENIYPDSDIWNAINTCQCSMFVPISDGLSIEVGDTGSNFSIGVRQLFCLARAVLQRKKIVFLDEITGFIDLETENLITKTLNEEFKSSTILAIAHRLAILCDFDRFVKIENGKAIEVPKDIFMSKENETIRDEWKPDAPVS